MLKGEKVILREMKQEDIARLHEFDQNVEIYGLDCAYPRASPIERAQAVYENSSKIDDNIAGFAIEADGKYIGSITLMNLRDRNGNFELGIGIGDRAYWGRGYGRDAIRLMLNYGFHYLGGRRIALTTNAKNERAIRCYLACGFIEEGRPRKVLWIEGEYVDLVNMSILYEEWQQKQ